MLHHDIHNAMINSNGLHGNWSSGENRIVFLNCCNDRIPPESAIWQTQDEDP